MLSCELHGRLKNIVMPGVLLCVLQVRRMAYRMLGEKVQIDILRCGVGFCTCLLTPHVVETERPEHSRQYQLSPCSPHLWLHSFSAMNDSAWWHLACGGVPLKLLLVCKLVLYCTVLPLLMRAVCDWKQLGAAGDAAEARTGGSPPARCCRRAGDLRCWQLTNRRICGNAFLSVKLHPMEPVTQQLVLHGHVNHALLPHEKKHFASSSASEVHAEPLSLGLWRVTKRVWHGGRRCWRGGCIRRMTTCPRCCRCWMWPPTKVPLLPGPVITLDGYNRSFDGYPHWSTAHRWRAPAYCM